MTTVISPALPGLHRMAAPGGGRKTWVWAAALLLLLAGGGLLLSPMWQRDGADRPVLAVEGGGFVFNYRIAEATYGLVARVEQPIPAGTRILTAFENPTGGAPIEQEQIAREGLTKLVLKSPPVGGVVAGRPYAVTVRLVSPAGEEIGKLETSFTSNIDQSVMPKAPLTFGPGYQKPPAN
jgi:hypothetical protein